MKFLILLQFILLTVACNNQLKMVYVPKANIVTPPYELRGIASVNFGASGAVTFGNADNAANFSTFQDIVTISTGTFILQTILNSSGAYKSRVYKIDSETGGIDTSFATGGYFDVPSVANLNNQHGYMYHMSPINDRYLMMCGYENPNAGPPVTGLVRLFDTQTQNVLSTFGTSGAYVFVSPDGTRPRGIITHCAYDQARNRIVFSGRIAALDWSIQQSIVGVLDMNGNLASDFNGGNVLAISHPSFTDQHGAWNNIVTTSTHYFFSGSQFNTAYTQLAGFVLKMNKSGVIDTGFASSGLFILPNSTSANDVLSVVDRITSDREGNLMLNITNFDNDHTMMAKISQSDGSFVSSFGTGGYLDLKPVMETELGVTFGQFYVSDFVQKSDGNYIVNWNGNVGPTDYIARLSEIDSTGALVPGFGVNGIYTFVVPAGKVSANGWSIPDAITGPFYIAGTCNAAVGPSVGCAWKIE